MTHTYEFRIRDLRTLAEVGEMDARVVSGRWTRSATKAGGFQLVVPRTEVSLDLLQPHRLLIVLREGQREFAGVIERREIDSTGRVWTLSGPDLRTFWLKTRVVGPTASDARSGVGEDVLRSYVDSYIGPSAPATLRAASWLQGITWRVELSSGRGGTVSKDPRRQYLDALVDEIAVEADLLPDVRVLPDLTGYEFYMDVPRNATSSSGGVPFGVDWDNVEELVFVEDFREHRNHIWVMGDGAADARNYTEVEDAASVAQHFRRDVLLDARQADTADIRQQLGELDILNRNRALVSVRAIPLRDTAGAEYRVDWDVGWDVTFLEAELRTEPIDVRVVAATVELSRQYGERVTFELGQQRATSQLRRLEEAIKQLRVASFE